MISLKKSSPSSILLSHSERASGWRSLHQNSVRRAIGAFSVAFPPRILVEQRDRAPKQPPHLIPKSGVLVAAGAVDAHLPHELRERITEDEL